MTSKLALKSFRLKNFKAVRDSKTIKFGALTVFIGNNGSGKSSIIEGLETYRSIVFDSLDEAMNRWKGFEYIQNQAVPHTPIANELNRPYCTNPIHFEMQLGNRSFLMEVAKDESKDQIFIRQEVIKAKKSVLLKRLEHSLTLLNSQNTQDNPSFKVSDNRSTMRRLFDVDLDDFDIDFVQSYFNMQHWQFVNLNPAAMGHPYPRRRTDGRIDLESDGSNIAEYLLSVRQKDQAAFDGIVEALQYVLPYSKDLQPAITSELERTVYLQMTEGNFQVPGWLLSTGTLRVAALLALLRHPEPAPLIVIEEIENGLDPRTMNLIVEEIRNVIMLGKTQVILTTHSPYLLDLLDLSHIVLVERDKTGQPIFTRPSNEESLQVWAEKYSPGKLYTMGRLQTQSDA